jgi:hypothetical protein
LLRKKLGFAWVPIVNPLRQAECKLALRVRVWTQDGFASGDLPLAKLQKELPHRGHSSNSRSKTAKQFRDCWQKKTIFLPFFLRIYLKCENVCVIMILAAVLFDRKQEIPKDSGAEILLWRLL